MCGFAGIMHSNRGASPLDTSAVLRRMVNSLTHRGPDSEGTWTDTLISLGHRRLSIVDLSDAGLQPMHSNCGRFVVVYNGEIYNHLSLRSELSSVNAVPFWRGDSDTETLLASVACWGLAETLRRAVGMFSLALWDKKTHTLSLARDRIGEKPLYWGWAGSSLVFGSELKALNMHPNISRSICRRALSRYLQLGYIPAPMTIYQGVYKLEPGCILSVKHSVPSSPPPRPLRPGQSYENLSIARYWSLNELVSSSAHHRFGNEGEAIRAVETSLACAVKRQAMGDVPLGAFLSGGIDSSLIVALLQAQSSSPLKTFTASFADQSFNEAPFAASISRYLGTDHTEYFVSEGEVSRLVPQLGRIYDEPFGDSSQIPTLMICKSARSRVTVALSGDGGDELFGGYTRYVRASNVWDCMCKLPFAVRVSLGRLIASVPVERIDRTINPFVKNAHLYGHKAHKLADLLCASRSVDQVSMLLSGEWSTRELLDELGGDEADPSQDPLPGEVASDSLARMTIKDMKSYLPDDILCKVDRAAMSCGLETRVPFLDPEVLSVSSRIPSHMKVRNGTGKWVLRQVLYRHIPTHLVDRPKAGFAIPLAAWLRGPLRHWGEGLLYAHAGSFHDIVDSNLVFRMWDEHISGSRDWSQRLWIVLMLMAWKESES